MGGKDYYKILEVHHQASSEVIKKAYQTLVMHYHPDRHIPAKKKWAEEKFKELSEAYQILSDPLKRRKYDRDGYSEEFDEFSRSRWSAEAKMRFAKFWLFKKQDYSKVNELLTDIIHLHRDTDLAKEAERLLEYTRLLKKSK